jgi:hypothetical protein
MNISIEIGIGEALDRLSILEIKKKEIIDPIKLENVNKEYGYLKSQLKKFAEHQESQTSFYDGLDLYINLSDVNYKLWVVEDKLRELEMSQDFSVDFIYFARQVYKLNDLRAKYKKEINVLFNSNFIEEKSYKSY